MRARVGGRDAAGPSGFLPTRRARVDRWLHAFACPETGHLPGAGAAMPAANSMDGRSSGRMPGSAIVVVPAGANSVLTADRRSPVTSPSRVSPALRTTPARAWRVVRFDRKYDTPRASNSAWAARRARIDIQTIAGIESRKGDPPPGASFFSKENPDRPLAGRRRRPDFDRFRRPGKRPERFCSSRGPRVRLPCPASLLARIPSQNRYGAPQYFVSRAAFRYLSGIKKHAQKYWTLHFPAAYKSVP